MRLLFLWIAGLTGCLAPLAAAATTAHPISDNVVAGGRVETPPTIDGVIEPGEWDDLPGGSGFYDERNGALSPLTGQFWIAYDEKYIYFAARLDDPDPSGIRAQEYRSNVSLSGDDSIVLRIDPFGRTGAYNQFGINPRGATQISIAGGRAGKREWLGEFYAQGRITATGWEAEARIPWGVMRLPSPGTRELSFNVSRKHPRTNTEVLWRFSGQGSDNYGRWVDVQVPASGNVRSLKLLPYVYGGWDRRIGYVANAGLDMKTSLTDQMDLVASINPDFRNIENQILSLDFSYFERLAGESRPFFLEGRDFFRSSWDAPIFASQRIRTFDLGVKAFGRITDTTSLAVLDTVDFGETNALVANVQHVPRPGTFLQAMVADLSSRAVNNQALHLSGNHLTGNHFFFANHQSTRDGLLGYGRRHNIGTGYNAVGLNLFAEYVDVSENFVPRLGFAPERNFKGVTGAINYFRPMPRGPLQDAGFSAFAFDFRTQGGDRYRRGVNLNLLSTWRPGLLVGFGARVEQFREFNDRTFSVNAQFPVSDPYRQVRVQYAFGQLGGLNYRSASIGAAFRPSRPLQLQFSGQLVQHRGTQTQYILGANYELSHDTSISGRAVLRDRDLNAYLAFRKSGNFGAEYFLILGDPNAPRFQPALVLKLIWPFDLRL